jgi:hypothetical protein
MGNQYLRSVGQRSRDSEAHEKIVTGVKELASLFHLPDSLFEQIGEARHRDAFMELMLQREALAKAVENIVAAVKGREDVIAENADLPEHFPGRNALLSAGVVSVASLRQKSKEDLIALPGIGKTQADRILSAIPKEPKPADPAKEKDLQKQVKALQAEVDRLKAVAFVAKQPETPAEVSSLDLGPVNSDSVTYTPQSEKASRLSMQGSPGWGVPKEAEIPDNG